MIQIFYKEKGKIAISQSLVFLDELGMDDVIWIDLFSPDGDEKRAVETFLDTSLSSRAQAEEIESSSRYSETDTTISVNTNFLIPGPDEYSMEAVSFILCEGIIVSIRNVQLRSFSDIQRRIQVNSRLYPTGYHVLIGIVENRIDLDADMIELMSKNVVDKQRMISSIMKSDKFPRDIFPKLSVINKDIVSLLNHTNFSFERLDYLQNTVVGLINLEQNRIMKVFTFVSLLLMPPTLIASIYGMNIRLPMLSEGSGLWNFFILLVLMIVAIFIVILVFRKRRML